MEHSRTLLRALTAITAIPDRATGQMILVLKIESFEDDDRPEILTPILCSENMLSQLDEAIPKMREQLRLCTAPAH